MKKEATLIAPPPTQEEIGVANRLPEELIALEMEEANEREKRGEKGKGRSLPEERGGK